MRLALISYHTSPLAPLGAGKAGGMNAYLLALGKELGSRGVEVDCFTRLQEEEGPAVLGAGPGMRVVSLPAGPRRPLPPPAQIPYLLQFAASVQAFSEGEGEPYDLLHAHYYLSGCAGLELKRSWQIPLLFTFHTLGPLKDRVAQDMEERESPHRRPMEERVASGADRIISSNPHEAEAIMQFYHVPRGQIAIVPCGVDTNTFLPQDRQRSRALLGLPPGKLLLFVGRMEPIKGIDLLLEALVRLRALPDLPASLLPRLMMVGGGEERNVWADRVRGLGLEARVLFLGPQPHQSMSLYYAACDVLVMPSRYESFGITALEAAACGRPVIAASVGGLPYAVCDGKTGLLVASQDADALALAIRKMVSEEGIAEEMGAAGRRWAEGFAWPTIADQILSCYERAFAPFHLTGKGMYGASYGYGTQEEA